MSKPGYPYNESLLQWIWQNLEYDSQNLRTECGQTVQIIDTGRKNHGAGPDFSGSVIRLDGLEFHGDTELHIYPTGWINHQHSASDLFNRVILHVVYDTGKNLRPGAVTRPDGTTPPVLVLKPYLQKSLQSLLEKAQRPALRCSGNVGFINQSAFEKQVEKAHHFYFDFKTNSLLYHYNPGLPVSEAWLGMLTFGLFHTLGIPVNRQPFEELHKRVLESEVLPGHSADFIEHVYSLAFDEAAASRLNWKFTGMRPASRPQNRVRQAASIYYSAHQLSFNEYLLPDLSAWEKIIHSVPEKNRPGHQMLTILKQTVFIPSAYLLGDILHSEKLKTNAYAAWRNIQGGVPAEVLMPFKESGFEINKQLRKPGLAHQLKRYCRPGNCHRCEVFKKAISS